MSDYIYLDKGYHLGISEKIYANIKNDRGIIISLDEEGGVDYLDASTIRGRYSETLFESVDFTFLWGKKQYEIIKNRIVDKNKIEITGHPRFELLKPEFHYLYLDEVQKLNEKYGDFILVNTNMGFGNNIKGDEFVRNNYGDRFKDIKRIISFDKEKLKSYRSLIIKLSEKVKLPIIVRPHPEEDHQFYFEAFSGRKNIIIISEGSVIPWLLAAQSIIHPDCTTAVEALFLGKESLSFLPNNYPEDLVTELPIKASKTFISIEKIIEYLNNNNDNYVDFNDFPFANEHFSITRPATKLIVERFLRIRNPQDNNIVRNLVWHEILQLRYREWRKNFRFGPSKKLVQSKLKGFNIEGVIKINERIAHSMGESNKVCIEKISKGLFLFNMQGFKKL